jgi:hypothetical protein
MLVVGSTLFVVGNSFNQQLYEYYFLSLIIANVFMAKTQYATLCDCIYMVPCEQYVVTHVKTRWVAGAAILKRCFPP